MEVFIVFRSLGSTTSRLGLIQRRDGGILLIQSGCVKVFTTRTLHRQGGKWNPMKQRENGFAPNFPILSNT